MVKREKKQTKARKPSAKKTAKATKGVVHTKKARKPKDKDAPKRGISAFFFYQKNRRAALSKENPKLDNKQIVSTMSQEWKALNEKARVPYNKLAEKDKERCFFINRFEMIIHLISCFLHDINKAQSCTAFLRESASF